jgi:hypothetical protein
MLRSVSVISDHRVCDVAAAIERVPAIGAAALRKTLGGKFTFPVKEAINRASRSPIFAELSI